MSDDQRETIDVDLRRRETEAGWQALIDQFALRAAPLWFGWIGWVLALAAILYLQEQSGSFLAHVAAGVSSALLWFYFSAFFARLRFKNIPMMTHPKVILLFSVIVSTLLAVGAWRSALGIARLVAAQQAGGCG